MEYISKSEKDTYKIAAEIYSKSQFGDVFELTGDLGSGKTAFVKSFAKVAGIKKEITSPTFVLLKQYPIIKDGSKGYLVHVDCYRMGSHHDAESIGLTEYFKRKDVILFIEWPEKIAKVLPTNTKKINFQFLDETTRRISLRG